jgi:hypothetical protein
MFKPCCAALCGFAGRQGLHVMYICTSHDYHSFKESIVCALSVQFCAHSKAVQLVVQGVVVCDTGAQLCPGVVQQIAAAVWVYSKQASKQAGRSCVWLSCAGVVHNNCCALGVAQHAAARASHGCCVLVVVQQTAAGVGCQRRLLARTASCAHWQHMWCLCCTGSRGVLATGAVSASAAAAVCLSQCV